MFRWRMIVSLAPRVAQMPGVVIVLISHDLNGGPGHGSSQAHHREQSVLLLLHVDLQVGVHALEQGEEVHRHALSQCLDPRHTAACP
jgi:hypothetical protein